MSEDPYTFLGEQLSEAARRQDGVEHTPSRLRAWLSRRLNAALIAVVAVLAGGAVAIAATGVLEGSPVRQSGVPSPIVAEGIPSRGGSQLLSLRTADPEGGLPWGMRLVRTTRGQLCVQVGRVDHGELGELGIDGAFHDDGRFHPLAPDILPAYGSTNQLIQCVLAGQIFTYQESSEDRSGASAAFVGAGIKPPTRDLRAIYYGVLGPHALSVTYRTSAGMRTLPVRSGAGAYLIVRPASHAFHGGAGMADVGEARAVAAYAPAPFSVVRAITFRFGSLRCSDGPGAPVATPCPSPRVGSVGPLKPTRSLHEPVHATALAQSRASCSRAFLLYPCYSAEVEFRAPYAVKSAGSEYDVMTRSSCPNARLSGWAIDRDVRRGETVRSQSSGLFRFCALPEKLQVRYESRDGVVWRAPVIVGSVPLRSR